MILYHGTRVAEEIIRKKGLKRLWDILSHTDYNRLIDEILAHYGYMRKDIPEWIWKRELGYRLEEYKAYSPEFQPYIMFTLDYEQAKSYSFMGGEFEYLLIERLFAWKTKNWELAHRKTVEGRGIPIVVTVDIPKEYVPQIDLEQMERIRKAGYDPYDGFTWDIPLFRDVPPEWIVKIEEIKQKTPLHLEE